MSQIVNRGEPRRVDRLRICVSEDESDGSNEMPPRRMVCSSLDEGIASAGPLTLGIEVYKAAQVRPVWVDERQGIQAHCLSLSLVYRMADIAHEEQERGMALHENPGCLVWQPGFIPPQHHRH
jgi:hypothetical protein